MDAIQGAITALYHRDGRITPSSVIEEARDQQNPLHNKFEWDDSIAGNEYRLIQARNLIRSVCVVIDGREESLIHVPIIKGPGEGWYQIGTILAENPDQYARALAEAQTRLDAARRAVQQLESIRPSKRQTRALSHIQKATALIGKN